MKSSFISSIAFLNAFFNIVSPLPGAVTSVKKQLWKPLFDAVYNGNLIDIQEIIEHGADLNLLNSEGWTALQLAALHGHAEIVELLIEKGSNVNAEDKSGNTALNLAANNENIVELLISNGADVNIPSVGETPLYRAALNGYEIVANLLIRNGANVNSVDSFGNTALNNAALTGREKIVDLLIQNGADINVMHKTSGNSPLHSAVINGHGRVLDCLIGNGAIVDVANRDGNTPLHFAVKYGHNMITDILLLNDANKNAKNKLGKSPLDLATEEGTFQIFDLLMRNSNATQKACGMYSAIISNRILGGDLAESNEFPWMAAIGFLNQNNTLEYNCGGTIISEYFILTAAHCVKESLRPVVVRLGKLTITDDEEIEAEKYAIQEVIVHPYYASAARKNDIALVRVARQILFTNRMRPACLQTDLNDEKTDQKLIITGWGRTSPESRNSSNDLLKTDVVTMPLLQCNKVYQNYNLNANQRAFRNGIGKGQYCAYDPNGRNDNCQGDSGGPLQIIHDDSTPATVVGIISFGISCGSPLPSIYARVAYYLYWIESNVWPDLLTQTTHIPLPNM